MNDELDAPESVDDLYLEVGEVPIWYPIMQGDVFMGVEVPGFDELTCVQVVMHPCAMRRGSDLVQRITVSPVRPYQGVNDATWRRSFRVMPLPSLNGANEDCVTSLLDMAGAPSSMLCRHRRIASLSPQGVLLLQQRLIFHQTRLYVDLETLQKQAAPVLTEMELQADWTEAAVDAFSGRAAEEVVVEAEAAFASWLDEDNRARRERLQRVELHADLRTKARAEIRSRYRNRSGGK